MKIKRILSTAMALCIAAPMAVSFSAKAIEAVYGDANGDSAVNLSDMVTLSQFLHGRKSNIDLDLADINRDSSVDSLDLVQLRKHLLSLIKNALKSSPVSANSKNLTAGLNENASDKGTKEIDDEFRLAHSQFALDLLKREAKADENVMYWIDDPEVAEWNFDAIAADQSFYLNDKGNIVICFNEGDVGPMSMGCPSFEIPHKVVSDILK